jgi:hypothetical protein
MTIADLGAIGEFVGSILVLVTLIYLAIQVHQTKQSVQSASLHSGISSMSQNNALLAANQEFADIIVKGLVDDELSSTEWMRYGIWLTSMFHVFQQHFLDSQKGLGDARVWAGEQRAMKDLLGNRGVARWWREMPSLPFSEEFMRHVDGLLDAADETDKWRNYRNARLEEA